MDLTKILSVSGLPGLFKMIGNRSNGLIVEDIDSGKGRFCSSRKYQFTPLESIAIYTQEDTIPLREVFEKMLKIAPDKIPTPDKSDDELKAAFKNIVPDYDEGRVYLRDMKKMFRWYHFLNDRKLLAASSEEEE